MILATVLGGVLLFLSSIIEQFSKFVLAKLSATDVKQEAA